ncbi:hypothetical protein NMG60_11035721 [Bertholletia excelsa]
MPPLSPFPPPSTHNYLPAWIQSPDDYLRKRQNGVEEMDLEERERERGESGSGGVIITNYVETSTFWWPTKNEYPFKRINPFNHSSKQKAPASARTRGYDRRAQLLAYAHELRHSSDHHYYSQLPQTQAPQNCTPTNKKWRWPSSPLRLRRLFHPAKGKHKGYQTEVDSTLGGESVQAGSKAKASGRISCSHFWFFLNAEEIKAYSETAILCLAVQQRLVVLIRTTTITITINMGCKNFAIIRLSCALRQGF